MTKTNEFRLATYRFWAYAATFGAIWGVFELTLGTFLKTLRIPLSGSLLAAIACSLLVAQRQLLSKPGITLATGLIAAACKSISPDGTIFGPMIGITSEALVVEIALTLLGRSWTGAVIAGALAALCPLSQKLLTDIAYYGGTIVTLYLQIVHRAAALVGATQTQVVNTGLVVLASVMSCGIAGALFGKWVSRRVDLSSASHPEVSFVKWDLDPKVDEKSTEVTPQGFFQSHKDWILFVLAVLAIAIQVRHGVQYSFFALLLFLPALARLRPRALKRMWRPKFWIITFIFAIISGLFLGPKDISIPSFYFPVFSSVGALAGLTMILRGAFIFALTSWISVALNRRLFLSFARRMGFGMLGNAISAAFGIMPELRAVLVSNYGNRITTRANLFDRATRVLSFAVSLAERSARHQLRPKLIAVIGDKSSGKTTTLLKLAEAARGAGASLSGVCQPRIESGGGGYELLDISTGERRSFAKRKVEGRGFNFEESGWQWARERILAGAKTHRVLVIDEVGKLEAKGGGHTAALLEVLNAEDNVVEVIVLGVQEAVSSDLAQNLGGFDESICVNFKKDESSIHSVQTILRLLTVSV